MGTREHFYAWRHAGASDLAAERGDAVMTMRMMGDTSLQTVQDHYFDSSLEHMQKVLDQWNPPIGNVIESSEGDDDPAN